MSDWLELMRLPARCMLPVRFLVPVAVAIIALSNFSLYGLPAHKRLSDDYRTGGCVGEHLNPADLYLATDWAFGDYMSYKYRRASIDMISMGVGRQANKNEVFREIRGEIRKVYAKGGAAYVPDPALLPPGRFELLGKLAGITPQDLDERLPGRPAFSCSDWLFRKLDRPPDE